MNDKNLYWIIPLTLLVGLALGVYVGIPKHIDLTVDYGENIVKVTDIIDNFNITAGECPDCNCIFKAEGNVCFDENEYYVIKKDIALKPMNAINLD